jgi:hypothetical protein
MSETPAPAPEEKVPLPTQDEEFVFKDIQSAPAWIDKGWAGYSNGPALQLPVDIYATQPYATKTARVGDTVKFVATKGAKPAHFEVIEGDASLEEGVGTIKPAMVSNASLEDMIKLGNIAPDDLGSDAKAQVSARTPSLAKVIDGTDPAPEAQDVAVKAQPA